MRRLHLRKLQLEDAFDGRISIVYGTHTHVQTADRVYSAKRNWVHNRSWRCGPDNSVLGVRTEKIIERLTTSMPVRFEFAEGHITMHGAIFDIDISDFKCKQVERVVF